MQKRKILRVLLNEINRLLLVASIIAIASILSLMVSSILLIIIKIGDSIYQHTKILLSILNASLYITVPAMVVIAIACFIYDQIDERLEELDKSKIIKDSSECAGTESSVRQLRRPLITRNCQNCKYYSGSSFLLCAVHPEGIEGDFCRDWSGYEN